MQVVIVKGREAAALFAAVSAIPDRRFVPDLRNLN
jgi:hypothetical protein